MLPQSDANRFVEVYLFFEGRCEEAIEYYRQHLGAEVTALMRYEDSPEKPPEEFVPAGNEKKIMHALFRIGSTAIMASDGGCGGGAAFGGFSLSLQVRDKAEADQAFAALADGGSVEMPMGETFWSPWFGMVKDKFGVGWMVNVLPEQAPGS